MKLFKSKRPRESRLEKLAERIAAEINRRAATLTPEEQRKADLETKKIADQVLVPLQL